MAAPVVAVLRPRRASPLRGALCLAALAAAAVLSLAPPLLASSDEGRPKLTMGGAFLVPSALQLRAAALGNAPALPAVSVPESAEAPQGLPLRGAAAAAVCGGSLLAALQAAGVIQRDVAMGGAVPKKQRSARKVRAAKIKWYKEGDRAAKRALTLARGIKAGTIDFIYGKPTDDDDYDDDEYDDDDYDDEDDDELSKKSLS
mmetsp:Transcript_48671/g.130281  ORF Transcript_48671/g.130281 Transcript_48671/m.130281 type:complete len:202 (-) Transcript_48671:96-701(-)